MFLVVASVRVVVCVAPLGVYFWGPVDVRLHSIVVVQPIGVVWSIDRLRAHPRVGITTPHHVWCAGRYRLSGSSSVPI